MHQPQFNLASVEGRELVPLLSGECCKFLQHIAKTINLDTATCRAKLSATQNLVGYRLDCVVSAQALRVQVFAMVAKTIRLDRLWRCSKIGASEV